MIIEPRFFIVQIFACVTELKHNVIQSGFITKPNSIVSMKWQSHIETVQPNLIGVNCFVPKASAWSTWLVTQLFFQCLDCLAVTRFTSFIVERIKNATGWNIIQIILCRHIVADVPVYLNISIRKATKRIQIKIIAGRLIHCAQSNEYAPIFIVPHIPVCFSELFCIGA